MKALPNKYTHNEEVANAASHFSGALLGVVALSIMLIFSFAKGNSGHITASIVFGFTLIALYSSSALTHWLPKGKTKDFFFNFDMIAIYLLIAGTYTPIAMLALKGTLGWTVMGIEWGLAVIGIIIKLRKPGQFIFGVNSFFLASYIIMGWLFVIAIPQLYDAMGLAGVVWIFVGGIFYSVGTVFFRLHNMKYHHLVWHLLVLGGSISHFIAIFYYVLPIGAA